MNLKFKVVRGLNYYIEATYLIVDVINNLDSIEAGNFDLISNREKFTLTIDEINNKFSDLYNFRKKVIVEALSIIKEENLWEDIAKFLDKDVFSNSFLLNMLQGGMVNSFSEISEELFLIKMASATFIEASNTLRDINVYENISPYSFKSSSWQKGKVKIYMEDMFELLEYSTYSDTTKITILKMFSKPEKYYNIFKSTFEKIEEIIKKCSHTIKDEIVKFQNYLISDEANKKLSSLFMLEDLSLDKYEDMIIKNKNDNNIYLYSSALGYYTGSLMIKPEDDSEMLGHIGIELFKLAELKKSKQSIEFEIIEKTKALGDNIRFDIIIHLKERPYYVKELAEKLNISSASLSHHLGILFQAGFIKADYDERKSYYSLKKSSFKELGELLIKMSEVEKNVKDKS